MYVNGLLQNRDTSYVIPDSDVTRVITKRQDKHICCSYDIACFFCGRRRRSPYRAFFPNNRGNRLPDKHIRGNQADNGKYGVAAFVADDVMTEEDFRRNVEDYVSVEGRNSISHDLSHDLSRGFRQTYQMDVIRHK